MVEVHVIAKVLLVSPDGKVLVLRRSASAPRRPLEGDIAGGWVDPGEDFTAAAIRETEEEAGITLKFDDLQLVYTNTEAEFNEKKNVSWLFFIGHTDKTEFKLSDEHDQGEWATLDEAIEKIPYKVQNDFLLHVRDNNLL